MDFLLINSSKLKVILSEEELHSLGIEAVDSDYDESCLRGSMNDILTEARQRCGFKLGKDRVLVQLYPSDSGAEIFVTKLSLMPARERKVINEAEELTTYSKKQSFYRFDSLSDLICAARVARGADVSCDVFMAEEGSFYIRLTEEGFDNLSLTDRLLEYGTRISSLPSGLDGEYGSLLIKDEGLSLLGRM